jgi:hypothetical protein
MAKVTDPSGGQWTVRRRRSFDDLGRLADAGGPGAAGVVYPLIVAGWGFWFIAHWFGLAWRITIQRDGKEVGEEEVRGWLKSRRRIQEIAELVAAGTLPASWSVSPN